MKKAFIAVIALGLLFYFFNMHYAEKRVLRIGVEKDDYVPNTWIEASATETNLPIANDPGHYAEGYDVQIARLVAANINAELQVKKLVWDDLLSALNRNEIDAIFSGMLDTKPRRELAAFSEFYDAFENEYTIIVDKNSRFLTARTISDFAGAKIVGQKGTHLDDVIDQIKGVVHMPPAVSVTEMVDMVNNRKADGAVINLDTGMSYVRRYQNLRIIRFHKEDGFYLDFSGTCAAVRKSDTRLLEDINKTLRDLSKVERQRIMDRTLARAWKHLQK